MNAGIVLLLVAILSFTAIESCSEPQKQASLENGMDVDVRSFVLINAQAMGQQGVGVVVTSQKYVVTCAHVVPNRDTVPVQVLSIDLKRFEPHKAAVLYRDRIQDLALLRFISSPSVLPNLEFGLFDDVVVPSWAHISDFDQTTHVPTHDSVRIFMKGWLAIGDSASTNTKTVKGFAFSYFPYRGQSGTPLINSRGRLIAFLQQSTVLGFANMNDSTLKTFSGGPFPVAFAVSIDSTILSHMPRN